MQIMQKVLRHFLHRVPHLFGPHGHGSHGNWSWFWTNTSATEFSFDSSDSDVVPPNSWLPPETNPPNFSPLSLMASYSTGKYCREGPLDLPHFPFLSGFPICPGGQEHLARWFTTLHLAPCPQRFKLHGLLHRCPEHSISAGQSISRMHSGRQLGGRPYP